MNTQASTQVSTLSHKPSVDINDIGALRRMTGTKGLRATAREFSAVLVGQMFKQMHAGVSTDGLMNGGSGERIFRELADEEYARMATNEKGPASQFADLVFQSLVRKSNMDTATQCKEESK